MPVPIGTSLGPYEIVAALGAGGMGEVYRARDTRLDRDVAVKVLPTGVAADPDRRARFEREARAVAALDHPHICGIYDVGDSNGTHYLVMPLLDGQILAARIEKGPLPLDQSLTIAGQIADALDKAHRQGIVHRDLKPANVMLTKAGAKLLDFGLAKLRAPGGPVTLSGTGTAVTAAAGTAEGTILGTLHYMAPEQVEGKDADARSDIWALGAVLYEMVTGVRPFAGDTAASVIGAILKDQPQGLVSRQPLAPASLDRLITTCLEKDPDNRWQSARDMTRELQWIAKGETRGSRSGPQHRRPPYAAAIASAVVAAALTGGATWLWRGQPPVADKAPPVRFLIYPEHGSAFDMAPATVPTPQLAVSRLNHSTWRVGESPASRSWSWTTSAPTRLATLRLACRARVSWRTQNHWRWKARSCGCPDKAVSWARRSHRWLPTLASPSRATNATWRWPGSTPSGTRQISGYRISSAASQRLTSDRMTDANPRWSADGSRIVFRSNRDGNDRLYQRGVAETRDEEVIAREPSLEDTNSLLLTDYSRDEAYFVLTNTGQATSFDVWVAEAGASPSVRPVVHTEFDEYHGVLSPDNRWIAYVSNETGAPQVFVRSFPEAGRRYQVSSQGGAEPHWRADGHELFFVGGDGLMMATAVTPGPALRLGPPTPLFRTRFPVPSNPYRQQYTVSNDGQRFLMVAAPESVPPDGIHVVLDWRVLVASRR